VKLRRGILPLGIALALLSAGLVTGQLVAAIQAQSGVSVSLAPSSVSLLVGEKATVDVLVEEGAQGLYGAQFKLTFDRGLLQVVDADNVTGGVQIAVGPLMASDLLETAGPDFVVAQNSVDQSQGVITFSLALLGPSRPADRGGVLASVTFQALALGQGSLSLLDVVLSDGGGRAVPSSPLGGDVTVLSTATPTPTALPLPTPTNTPAPAPTAAPEPKATTPPPSPTSEGLSGGALAGIVIAVVAGVAAAVGAAVLLLRRRGRQPG
jgi:hypothetical protein